MKARTANAVVLNVAVALIALIVMFPLAWMVSVSFMSTGEAAVFPPPLLPSRWTLEHYRDLFVNQGMGRYMWNSFALASLATLLALAFTVPAGYAFAKLRFKGRDKVFQLFAEPYVMTQGGPAQSTVTVLYFMYEEGFKWWNLGSASAVAFILFLCIFAVTLVQLAVSRRLGGDHT